MRVYKYPHTNACSTHAHWDLLSLPSRQPVLVCVISFFLPGRADVPRRSLPMCSHLRRFYCLFTPRVVGPDPGFSLPVFASFAVSYPVTPRLRRFSQRVSWSSPLPNATPRFPWPLPTFASAFASEKLGFDTAPCRFL